MDNIAILWDLENVNPGNNSLFLDRLIEYAETFGRVVTARAYGNWSNPVFARIAPSLVKRYFFLIHIPKGKKNSSDIGLIADSFELLRLYTHIDTYFLITGDGDFRYLINSLRRAGKKTNIVCNTQSASEDLLALADSYIDFRELIPQEEEEEEEVIIRNGDYNQTNSVLRKMDYEDRCYLLLEAVESIIKEKKRPRLGLVKMRMRKYNPNFDEKIYKFSKWSDFITAAMRAGYIEIKNERVFPLKRFVRSRSEKWKLFEYLHEVLTELDHGKTAKYHELAIVNQKLVNKKIYVKVLGYKQFKDFIRAAEARKLVEYRVDGLSHFVKRAEK